MKLLKLSEEHYILADKIDINVGDWVTDTYLVYQCKDNRSLLGMRKVTRSTQPLGIVHGDSNKETITYGSTGHLPISEVKELLGLVDVDRKAEEANGYALYGSPNGEKYLAFREGFVIGYNQATKENKYTKEDMVEWTMCMIAQYVQGNTNIWDRDMLHKSLPQPKTEWDVEIIDGKLKLK